ncbi:MAG: hypothetical protein JNJ61_19360 [Anaerolineae bacterium]|nr:hypothetical protein [Anaerolineae bacterium]
MTVDDMVALTGILAIQAINAIGVGLKNPAFYTIHSDLLPLLLPFTISLLEGETYSVDIPDRVYAPSPPA